MVAGAPLRKGDETGENVNRPYTRQDGGAYPECKRI